MNARVLVRAAARAAVGRSGLLLGRFRGLLLAAAIVVAGGSGAAAAEPRAEDVLPRRAPPGPGTLADLVEEGRRSEGGVPSPTFDGPRRPVPPVDRLSAAQRLFDEVFAAKLSAARTPQEKVKLARDILDTASSERDDAARYVAWRQARALAVEARDGALGLQTARLLAGQFESDAGPAADAERLARADRLWAEAERAEGKPRLERQLEAVGEYWRAAPQSGLVARKWDARIESVAAFGKIVLAAKDAKCVGTLRYTEEHDSIGWWDKATDFVEWSLPLSRGEYAVTITYANGQTGKGGIIGVSVCLASQQKPFKTLAAEVRPTLPPGGFTFADVEAGRIAVPKDGDYRIVVHPVQMNQKFLAQLRSITLEELASASR